MSLEKSVLIVGALGFIGSHLLRHFHQKGYRVTGLTSGNNTSHIRVPLHLQPFIVKGQLLDFLKHFQIKSFDLIINCASHGNYSWQNDTLATTQGFQDLALLLEQCKNTGTRLINLGSSSEYGENIDFKDESISLDSIRLLSLYGVTKLAQSQLIAYYGQHYQVACIHLRLFSIYGPLEHPGRLIPTLCQSVIRKKPMTLSKPETQRDFVFIEDLISAIETASMMMRPSHYGRSFNIGSGTPTSLGQIAKLIEHQYPETPVEWDPKASRNWDLKAWSCDPHLFESEFGWRTQVTFEEGFQETLNFYKMMPDYLFDANCFTNQSDISIIITCYNHATEVSELLFELQSTLLPLEVSYEILILDDADPDGSFEKLTPLLAIYPKVTLIRNSRNLGSQYSLLKALKLASGKAVVTMDGDKQDPPEIAGQMIQKWKSGSQLVLAKRVWRQESLLMNLARKVFYRIWQMLSVQEVPLDVGDFCLVSRDLMTPLIEKPPYFFSWRSYRLRLKVEPDIVPYKRPANSQDKSSNSFFKLAKWSLRFITAGPNHIGLILLFVTWLILTLVDTLGLIGHLIMLLSILITLAALMIELAHQATNFNQDHTPYSGQNSAPQKVTTHYSYLKETSTDDHT